MRLRVKTFGKARLSRCLVLCAVLGLTTACIGSDNSAPDSASASTPRGNGPQADFPILVGPAYEINGVTYTPSETLNYDEVGRAIVDESAFGITGSHHTLPVPSYVEVTSLDTGRTILARIEKRGPMDSNDLIALSPAALAQLEAESGLAVRVRRVNPPEEQRTVLRAGQSAPLRMDTPMSLVNVLRRKLPQSEVAEAAEAAPVEEIEMAQVAAAPADPMALPETTPAPKAPAPVASAPAVEPFEVATTDRETGRTQAVEAPRAYQPAFFVQAATFSTQERADRAAQPLDAFVVPGGRFFRVRTGPFATREEAAASLAKIRAAGYDDARILTGG